MIHPRAARLAAAGLALALSAGLAGCITLFPKEKPVQLYRFDAAAPPAPASGQSSARPFAVRTSMSDFDPAAAGDRIMTVDGDQVAYLSDGRWSSPASQLFDQAVAHGFAASGDAARLVGPSGKADYRLHLTVRRFEARYSSGPTSAPTIVVLVRATLERQSDLGHVGTQEFEADVPAGDNRVGPIVQAFDQAATKVVGDLVAWVDQKGGGS
jgi:cholesterol transport system auxiliary component